MLCQLWKRNLQWLAESEHRSQRRALDATFEQTDVGSVKITFEAELFLRKADLLPQFPQRLPECLLRSGIGLDMPASTFHRQVYRAILWTIDRRTIVRICLETGVGQMPGEISSSAHGQMNDVVDITDAVHLRIISDSERTSLAARGRLSEEEDNISFRRLIPRMREEAQFWFLAKGERGIVICSTGRIEYVPEPHLVAHVRDPDVQTKLMMSVKTYNPLSEAVLEFVDEGVSSVVVVGEKG
jgi:hypothetical protein